MATKVFISWSGDLSRKLAQAVYDWLPGALQYVKPYFSPKGVEKGTKWDKEIATELESSDIGLICLVRDNLEAPWILFEAGALSKSIEKSRVCTVLFGLEPTDVKGPLATFQSTKFNKDDFKELVSTINIASAEETKLSESVLDSVFEKWWPDLEASIKKIIDSHTADDSSETRTEKDMIKEILELTRMNASRSVKSLPANIHEKVMITESLTRLSHASRRGDHEKVNDITKEIIDLMGLDKIKMKDMLSEACTLFRDHAATSFAKDNKDNEPVRLN